jgi:hypothetical protein
MGIRNFFGFGFTGSNGFNRRNASIMSRKNIVNATMSSGEKETIYKNRFNIWTYIKNKRSPDQGNESIPITDLEGFNGMGGFTGSMDVYSRYVYSIEASKEERLQIYREMAKYPEISFAIDEFVNEGINFDKEDKFMELIIKSDAIRKNDNLRKTIQTEWDRLMYDTLETDRHARRWFREYLIDGEIGFEKVIDNLKPEKGVVGMKKLRTSKMHALWEDVESEKITIFFYRSETQAQYLPPESVAYASSGLFEYNKPEDDKLVLSFLEPAKTTYKRLKQIEDAVVIYRLVRAPERRVFKIDVGNLPKGRAEAFVKDMMTKYRQRKLFDPVSGQASEGLEVMAMTEDYWLPLFNQGRSSEITTLEGGQNLGEIEDVKYFLNKLYRGLKVPIKRFESDTGFSIGDTSDITREEVKFVKEVQQFSKEFASIFKQIFITHLTLKNIVEETGISNEDISVHMSSNNLFDRYFEAKVDELKAQKFSVYQGLINTETPMFSQEWVAKKKLEVSDDDWTENVRLLTLEKEANPPEAPEGT